MMNKSVGRFINFGPSGKDVTEEEFLSVLNMDLDELDKALRDPEQFTTADKKQLQKIVKSKGAGPKSIVDRIKELRGIASEVSGSLTDAPTVDVPPPESKTNKPSKPVSRRRSDRLAAKAK